MKWKRVESVDIEPASVNINLPHVFVKSLPYSLSVGKSLAMCICK